MDHIYNLADVHLLKPSVVTIGVFDGVHRGHQVLIRRLVERARAMDRLPVVLTFFPHPDIVLRGLTGRYYLTSPEQRAQELGKLGIECVVTHPFDEATRQIRAAEFVDQLQRYLRVRELWVGRDFALGYQREGNVTFLAQRGHALGFDVQAVDLVQDPENEIVISSTMIREALERGDVDQAKQWLGRAYTVVGRVAHGQKRGRTIGFPTANIDVWEQQVLPAIGVYAGFAEVNGEQYPAVTNIGIRPTFAGETVTVEAHLLDFNQQIYDQEISFSFEARLRGEKKFDGIDALIRQITMDVEAGRALLQEL